MTQPSLSWALAAMALAHALDKAPLDKGSSEGVVGKWRIVVNNSELHVTHIAPPKPNIELPPLEIYVENLEVVSFGLIGPQGGIIRDYSEDQFIRDLIPHLSTQTLHDFGAELSEYDEYNSLMKGQK